MNNRPTMSMAVDKEHYLELLESWLDHREANINKATADAVREYAQYMKKQKEIHESHEPHREGLVLASKYAEFTANDYADKLERGEV